MLICKDGYDIHNPDTATLCQRYQRSLRSALRFRNPMVPLICSGLCGSGLRLSIGPTDGRENQSDRFTLRGGSWDLESFYRSSGSNSSAPPIPLRGGSWDLESFYLCASNRNNYSPATTVRMLTCGLPGTRSI